MIESYGNMYQSSLFLGAVERLKQMRNENIRHSDKVMDLWSDYISDNINDLGADSECCSLKHYLRHSTSQTVVFIRILCLLLNYSDLVEEFSKKHVIM